MTDDMTVPGHISHEEVVGDVYYVTSFRHLVIATAIPDGIKIDAGIEYYD